MLNPEDEEVGYYVLRKDEREAVYLEDGEDGPQERFRVRPRRLKLFAGCFDILDAADGHAIGQVRKREYKAERKEEWLLLDGAGDHVGMVVLDPSRIGSFQQVAPLRIAFPMHYSVHWGQSVAGWIQRRSDILLQDHMRIDLSVDPRTAVDRRLVLSVAYCIRDGDRLTALDASP